MAVYGQKQPLIELLVLGTEPIRYPTTMVYARLAPENLDKALPLIPCLFRSLHGAIDHRCGDDGQAYSYTSKKAALGSCFSFLFPLFMLMAFQIWMILLLFGRDSLPLVRGAIFVCSFRARFDTHGRFPL